MKVTFRCKQSGNCVSFLSEDDIASMRKEIGYEEVKDAVQEIAPIESSEPIAPVEEVVRRGRPRKAAVMEI